MRWVNVQEIYADGKHNAWPDICRWRNRYYVIFNSGGVGHSNGHSVCLLSSVDGERWEKVIPFLKDYIALAVLRKYENEVSFAIADFGYFPRISLNCCCIWSNV